MERDENAVYYEGRHPDFRNVKYFGMRINERKAHLRGGYKKRGVK